MEADQVVYTCAEHPGNARILRSIMITMEKHLALATEINGLLSDALGVTAGANVHTPDELIDDIHMTPPPPHKSRKITVEKAEQLLSNATTAAERKKYSLLLRNVKRRERIHAVRVRKQEYLRDTHVELRKMMYACKCMAEQLQGKQ